MKVEIIIPDGKYCDGCQLFDNGSSYEYSCWCNYIDKSLETVYDGGFVKKTLKHSKCPSYEEYRMDKYLLEIVARTIYDWFGDEDTEWKDVGEVTQDRFTDAAESVLAKAEPLIRQETVKEE